MEYDSRGYQISLTDPNAGTIRYIYDALGRLERRTDAKGNNTVNVYDGLGRLDYSLLKGVRTEYDYGTSGYDNLRLTSIAQGGNTNSYSYDRFGRVREETVHGVTFKYAYNANGQLSATTLPADLDNGVIGYEYDNNGFMTRITADGQEVWELVKETGLGATTQLGGTMTSTETRSRWHNMLTGQKTVPDATGAVLHDMSYTFDTGGNLRTGMTDRKETFVYDQVGRLMEVNYEGDIYNESKMEMTYYPNGNISYKTGAETYVYNSSKPHAVNKVTNYSLPGMTQSVTYTAFNKVATITEALPPSGTMQGTITITYGPTQERMQSVQGSTTITYAGNYEKVNGKGRYHIYAGGKLVAVYTNPTNPANYANLPPVVQERFAPKIYYVHTDHLGSVVRITKSDGSDVFKASYDAWGKQKVITQSTEPPFYRGYTGHEHIPNFGLINMNGRVYDPGLGRFLSPDPYVQMPDFSQNFNRYSYVLNNPLKYTDPSGESFLSALASAFSFGLYGLFQHNQASAMGYSSAQSYLYAGAATAITAASMYAGNAIAVSGIPMANTFSVMGSSLINSTGMSVLNGGKSPISMSFGVASYDFTNNEFGYLGKKGNTWYENVGYSFGAMANLADLGQAGNLFLNTEKNDIINHSAILDENGNTIISEGPGRDLIQPKGTIDHYLNRFLGGSVATNEYPIYGENMAIKNVNVATINNYGRALDALTQTGNGVLPYSFLYSSCSTHTGLALNLAGIPTLFLHPYTVQGSVWLWNAGITPAIINNSYHLQNYR